MFPIKVLLFFTLFMKSSTADRSRGLFKVINLSADSIVCRGLSVPYSTLQQCARVCLSNGCCNYFAIQGRMILSLPFIIDNVFQI
jgi:hypothetical protein